MLVGKVWIAICCLILLCGCESRKPPQKSADMSRTAPGRYVPTGSDSSVALDTQTGRLCRTVEAANDRPDLSLCGKGDAEQAEQVTQVDADTSQWANAEVTVTCSDKKLLVDFYSVDGKGKSVTVNCTIKNLTSKTVLLAAFDKVVALFRLPDGRVVRGHAYLGSNQREIKPRGEIENAGLFAGNELCPVKQSNVDCVQAELMTARELLITDTMTNIRYHVRIE